MIYAMTAKTAAKRYGVTSGTIHKWVRRGLVRVIGYAGTKNTILIDGEAVAAAIIKQGLSVSANDDLTLPQAAEALGVSRGCVRNLIASNKLSVSVDQRYRQGCRCKYRVSRSSVERLLSTKQEVQDAVQICP